LKVSEADRERFEQDYKDWLRLMARDAAYRLSVASPKVRATMLDGYSLLKDPHSVFREPPEKDRMLRLAGERISGFVVAVTDAVTFFPSIYRAGALDYAVAMNRRFFYNGLWFPIIALNNRYVVCSTDRRLTFALEHEFEMSRIYMEISMNLRALSPDEKRDVADSAKKFSIERQKITDKELIEDERLMIELSGSSPLIPKPYVESAMLVYLDDHFDEIVQIGQKSRNLDEEAFGLALLEEFRGWSDLSQRTYRLFVQEILSNLRDANKGYA
jgi:hypothetical protein